MGKNKNIVNKGVKLQDIMEPQGKEQPDSSTSKDSW